MPGGERLIGDAAARSFVESFPQDRFFVSVEGWGLHMLGSRKPIPKRTVEELVARLSPAAQADMLEWYQGADAKKVLTLMLANEYPPKVVLNPDKNIYISDDRPFNEYFL